MTYPFVLFKQKVTKSANNYAISSGGLGQALKNSASSLEVGGNSLDQSIAMITAANEIAQDPSKVGNGLRTIALRIRGMDVALKEAGEDTGDMVESVPKLREEIQALAGVDIMDGESFKSTYQIIDEISAKWDELSDTAKAAITEDLAGKNRANIFNALVSNFSQARKALETSMNSEGSAMREHEKWMESLEAKTLQLQASLQSLSQTVLDSGFLKAGLDGIIAIVNGLDTLIQKIGIIPTLLGGAGITAFIKNLGFPIFFSEPSVYARKLHNGAIYKRVLSGGSKMPGVGCRSRDLSNVIVEIG